MLQVLIQFLQCMKLSFSSASETAVQIWQRWQKTVKRKDKQKIVSHNLNFLCFAMCDNPSSSRHQTVFLFYFIFRVSLWTLSSAPSAVVINTTTCCRALSTALEFYKNLLIAFYGAHIFALCTFSNTLAPISEATTMSAACATQRGRYVAGGVALLTYVGKILRHGASSALIGVNYVYTFSRAIRSGT